MPKIKYTCTCPDYLGYKDGQIYSRGFSSTRDSNWTSSRIFSEREEGFMCKHIIRARIAEGELDDIPVDVPIDAISELSRNTGSDFRKFKGF
jgi:hypothetical protein